MNGNKMRISLLQWYQNHVRPFFTLVEPDKVQQLDCDAERLAKAENSSSTTIHACFLGSSGIGKSTLINAMIAKDQTIIPAGGIGPLTAQALKICYGDFASFKVEYHTSNKINNVIFALQKIYKNELAKRDFSSESPDNIPDLDVEEIKEIEDSLIEDNPERDKKKESYTKQAQLMITGKQQGQRDTTYLVDGLKTMLGKNPLFGTNFDQEDLVRINKIKDALQKSKNKQSFECSEQENCNFKALLKDHATGFMAPIIKTLEIQWKSDLLEKGLVLVDLPGVGIVGDTYANVTAEYIREKAKAVILVVSTRGVQETEATMLRDSGFLNRLLHTVDDPSADPVSLMVVVTRVDDIAREHYSEDKNKKKWEHFQEICGKTIIEIKSQVICEIEKIWQISNGTISEEKKSVIETIKQNLKVIPLSAIEYRKFHEQDPEDPSFITNEEQSNIPQLIKYLKEFSDRLMNDNKQRLKKHRSIFFSTLTSQINLVKAQWEDETRTSEEVEKLKGEVNVFLAPIYKEHSTREGEFRGFLKNTIPTQIDALVTNACDKSRREVFAYLGKLKDAHWATLRAAVRRDGTFYGARYINLPSDFAIKFEEPIAEIWGKKLLLEIRKKTKEYADDCIVLVEQVVDWAKEQGTKIRMNVLEAQQEAIKADAKNINTVGKEAVNELRESVKNNLIKKIEGPIRRKCQNFVKKGDDIGPGVKRRILELFKDLADDSIEAAKDPAIGLLQIQFCEVQSEIIKAFKRFQDPDPITAVKESILSTHEGMLKRRDKKMREKVLTMTTDIMKDCPEGYAEHDEVC